MTKNLLWLWLLCFTLLVGCRSAERNANATAAATESVALALSVGLAPSTATSTPVAEPSAAPATSTSWKRPVLFRVKTRNKSAYLFGTIHLPDPRLDTFPPSLAAAFGESEVVFTEIPMDDATQLAIAPQLLLPQGQSLGAVVPAPLLRRVQGAFSQQGIPFEPFERMKPWAVSVQVAVLDRLMTLALKKPIDALIYQRAQEQGKEANALETPKEQLSIFDALKRNEQIELLRLTMDYRDTTARDKRDVLEELLAAYLAGNGDAIEQLMREAYDPKSALAVKLMKRVFFDRNESMTQRIVAHIEARPGKSQFFAVGCGHVVGSDGIAARLQKRNFEVSRVEP